MKIIEVTETEDLFKDVKSNTIFMQFKELIAELNKKELPEKIIVYINENIEELNASSSLGKDLQKSIKKQQENILKLIMKELKIVPINYYRKLWFVMGMSTFGIPIGIAFGLILGNMGLLGIGFPIGMGIGAALGSFLDKKALKEGRQLNFELKN